jgi:hypothetical protein
MERSCSLLKASFYTAATSWENAWQMLTLVRTAQSHNSPQLDTLVGCAEPQ